MRVLYDLIMIDVPTGAAGGNDVGRNDTALVAR
jgi:hypothetical protein